MRPLSTCKRRVLDWIDPKHNVWVLVTIPRPVRPGDIPTLLVTVANGQGRRKVMFRVKDFAAWDALWTIPAGTRARLEAGLDEAWRRHGELVRDEPDALAGATA